MALASLGHTGPLLGAVLPGLAYRSHLQFLEGPSRAEALRPFVALDYRHRAVRRGRMAHSAQILDATDLCYSLPQGYLYHLLADLYCLYLMGALGVGNDVVIFCGGEGQPRVTHRRPVPDYQAPDLYRPAGHALRHGAHERPGPLPLHFYPRYPYLRGQTSSGRTVDDGNVRRTVCRV